MASLHAITPQSILSLSKAKPISQNPRFSRHQHDLVIFPRTKQQKRWTLVVSTMGVMDELDDVIRAQSKDCTDQQGGEDNDQFVSQVGAFATSEGEIPFDGVGVGAVVSRESREFERIVGRVINAFLVLAGGTLAVIKLLTIDRHYWHGWTISEILRYAPQHCWSAYMAALKTNPVLAKMVISGVVYALGDWIAQCVEGKPLFEFDRGRMFRSGLVGFMLHGSICHYYYLFCEELFPFQAWWVVPAKVALDQTVWSAIWNSIYYTVIGFLRLDSPVSIYNELRATFWPTLTAGWKLWPFAHLITYGVIPVEHRLLWVDCIELIWVTILSTFSNEKSEEKVSPATVEVNSSSPLIEPPKRK